jgi:predicted Rossmann-fold nucleotide-binding protein
MKYAGIGSRKLSQEELARCFQVGVRGAEKHHTLVTGAALGADQAFANGALSAGGTVILELPWWSYEEKWVNWAVERGAIKHILQDTDTEAWKSVLSHPAYNRLSRGALALHARNYNIIYNTELVVAFPKPDKYGLGGTGQGIRLAENLGIKIHRMDQ